MSATGSRTAAGNQKSDAFSAALDKSGETISRRSREPERVRSLRVETAMFRTCPDSCQGYKLAKRDLANQRP